MVYSAVAAKGENAILAPRAICGGRKEKGEGERVGKRDAGAIDGAAGAGGKYINCDLEYHVLNER